MNKLKLDLDDLRVESFDTTPGPGRREGTVFGQGCTCYTNCTCPGCPSCDPSFCDTACNTCPDTCGDTCDGLSCWDTCGPSCGDTCGTSCRCRTADC